MISKPSKHAIQAVENAPLFIAYKINTLLVACGLKRASEIHLYSQSWLDGQKPKHVSPSMVRLVSSMLKGLGVEFEILPPHEHESNKTADPKEARVERIVICLAGNKADLTQMKEVWTELKPEGYPVNERLHGELSSFPESAVLAFVDGTLLSSKESDEKLEGAWYKHFVKFRLSENWHEEAKTGEVWAKAIKELSPKIYNDYTAMMRK